MKQCKSTLKYDFESKTVVVGDRVVDLQIWDTAGQERYQSLGTSFYRGSDCAFVVYDVTDRKSFEQLSFWVEDVLEMEANAHIVIIGQKIDLEKTRVVAKTEGEEWSSTHGYPYYETSAKDNINVKTVFLESAKILMQQSVEIEPELDHNEEEPASYFSYCALV